LKKVLLIVATMFVTTLSYASGGIIVRIPIIAPLSLYNGGVVCKQAFISVSSSDISLANGGIVCKQRD